MRILLTNHTLESRSGTELYVRDLALALLARGHQPIAYSRRLGEVADELRRATVTVLDDLDRLTPAPDLIHAHHHLETMTALARFPRTPAIYVCHGWLPAEEAPPRHPRIRRYVAVDELVRQRLIDECGLPAERVTTLLNWVDLERFRPRPALPLRPARALVFNNEADESNSLPILRAACRAAGLELDVLGLRAGSACARPEDVLGAYDVVFAKARCALEAAAVGAAVILCNTERMGTLVTAAEVSRLRAWNFGVRLLGEPLSVSGIARELARYDAGDAAEVSRHLRENGKLSSAVDAYESLYADVLAQSASAPPVDPEDEARALAGYLRRGPLTAGDFSRLERERLVCEIARLQAELTWMKDTASWRWRGRVQRQPWLRAFYRSVVRRR